MAAKKEAPQGTKNSPPKVGEYNGKPMLILNPDDRFAFQFGLTKAKLIVINIEAIRRFVADNDKSQSEAKAA